MPGLSHPKAQGLCVSVNCREKRILLLLSKRKINQPTYWKQVTQPKGSSVGDPADDLRSGSTLPQLYPKLPPIGTCHLPMEGHYGKGEGGEETGLLLAKCEPWSGQPSFHLALPSEVWVRDFGAPCLPCIAKAHWFQLFAFVLARQNIFITFSITYRMSFCCLPRGFVSYNRFGAIYYCLVFVLCF